MALAGVGVALSACTSFDPADNRTTTINRNTTDYANDAVLLNIIRAKEVEPLTFITITGLDGTNSVTGGLGFGGFTLGPFATSPPRNYVFGPDSLSRTGSNTVHISVVDDPASFEALMTPVNPAEMGFFINQGYPRELIFFLLVDKIEEVTEDENGKVTGTVQTFRNDPVRLSGALSPQAKSFKDFAEQMADFLYDGMTAEVDVTSVPAGRAFPPSRFCFDTSLPAPSFAQPGAASGRPGNCANASWIASSGGAASATSSGSQSTSGDSSSSTYVAARDGALWIATGSQDKVYRVDRTGKVMTVQLPPAKAKPKPIPSEGYLVDYWGKHFRITMRSTYGVYDYVGALLRAGADVDNLLGPDEYGSGGMVEIVRGGAGPCFAEIEYEDEHYCVPKAATHTKRLFALLHQLQELSTAPSNSPTTLTVTAVP